MSKSAGRRRFRRLAIGVFLIVIIAHVIVGLGSAIWIVARYFAKPQAQFIAEKRVEMKPEERKHQLKMDEVSSLRPATVYNNRIQSLRPSALVLPDISKVPVETMVPIQAEPVAVAAVGEAAPSAMGQGPSNAKGGFFGSGSADSGLMEGTFYDLKQTPEGKPTEMGAPGADIQKTIEPLLRKFAKTWNPNLFRGYFQGPDKLYASQLSIPEMKAEMGPKEFGLGSKVQPSFWVVLYKGRVIAPKTGRFRFVGTGDDALMVRFARKNVLDAADSGPFSGRRTWRSFPIRDSSRRPV